MSNTDQILEQILNFLQKAQINNRLRDDSPSKGFDELNQAYKKSLGEDRKILEEIKKFKNWTWHYWFILQFKRYERNNRNYVC